MFLLDTNILSERIKKRPNPHLLERLSSHRPEALFISISYLNRSSARMSSGFMALLSTQPDRTSSLGASNLGT